MAMNIILNVILYKSHFIQEGKCVRVCQRVICRAEQYRPLMADQSVRFRSSLLSLLAHVLYLLQNILEGLVCRCYTLN